MGMYIAENLGALHIAPLPGHVGTVFASNMRPALGTIPPYYGPQSVDVAPPPPASPPPPPPGPPRPAPVPPVAPAPVPPPPPPRTW